MAIYEDVRELEPRKTRALINMGAIHLAAQETEQAAACYEAAVEIAASDFDANQNLGGIRMLQGRPADAAESFLRATEADPESLKAWFGRMRACQASEDVQGTLDAAVRLLELVPDDFVSLRTAAVASESLGQTARAEEFLKRAIEKDAAKVDAHAERDPQLSAVLERLR